MRNIILIVDDMKFNRMMLKNVLMGDYATAEAANGKEAMAIIEKHHKELAAVLLDIVMPEMGGIEVLKEMNEKKLLGEYPVLIITAEQDLQLVGECFDYGISDFIRKPFNSDYVKQRVEKLMQLYVQKNDFKDRLERQTATLRNQYKLLQLQSEQLKKSNENIIDILGTVVEFRNMESEEHIQYIKKFTEIIANHVMKLYPEYELTPEKIRVMASASALHDVGKILISDSILLKPGKLTEEEFEYMRSHSIRGYDIINRITGVWDEDYAQYSREITRSHHEKYDGNGYPDGLKGDEIPISAQIVSIADCYCALISDNVYRAAFSADEAYHMIVQGECGVFSPKILECFQNARQEMEAFAADRESEEEESVTED